MNCRRIFSLGLLLACPALLFAAIPCGADLLENWTVMQLNSTNKIGTNNFYLNLVAYGNNRFVAYGTYSDWGLIFSSEDGKDWTLRSDGYGPVPSDLSYGLDLIYVQSQFFALGGFGTSAVSSNGINWTTFSFPNYGTAYGIAYGAGKYLAAGDANLGGPSYVFSSTNGMDWISAFSPGTGPFTDIAYGAGRFVLIGPGTNANTKYIWTSSSGITWTQRALINGARVCFLSNRFIIPNAPGTNLISSDGITWSAEPTGVTNWLAKPIFANGLYLAKSGNYLTTSADGTNWVQYPKALPDDFGGANFATDGFRLIITSNHIKQTFSYDAYIYLSEPLVSLKVTNDSGPKLNLSGLVGRSYKIEKTDALSAGSNYWQTLTNIQLPSISLSIADPTASTFSQRFYRAVLLP